VLWVNTTGRAGAVDSRGDIYATDGYQDVGPVVSRLHKYDSSGKSIWSRTIRGVYLQSVAVNIHGEPIYIFVGDYTGTVKLDEHQLQNGTGLVAKADAAGQFKWVAEGKGTHPVSVISDPTGSIYVTGSVFDGLATFASLPLSIENGGTSDFFLVQIVDVAPGVPELKIARSGSRITLSWAASVTSFVLERAESLSMPVWSPVPGSGTREGDEQLGVYFAVNGP
jgi:hypothetical protein